MASDALYGSSSKSFDMEKFKQVLQYVILKTSNTDNIGKTVLYKILYFIDFNYYELFEGKLTGETYLKYPYGPAPRDFDDVMSELKDEGLIEEKKWTEGRYSRIKYLLVVEPDTCRKQNVSFLKYVKDIISNKRSAPWLFQLLVKDKESMAY